MKNSIELRPIAKVFSGFPEKFGIPRQSGLVDEIKSVIRFEPELAKKEAVRGLEGFSHIWLIWYFSENDRKKPSLTVRPPRLGGNTRVGVFATRSPYRPNPIGLSLAKIEKIEFINSEEPVIHISGADLMNETPVFDIKPYLPYADCRPEAVSGFAKEFESYSLKVVFADGTDEVLDKETRRLFAEILSQDPRPAYQSDPERIYSFEMYGYGISFSVSENVLTVRKIVKPK